MKKLLLSFVFIIALFLSNSIFTQAQVCDMTFNPGGNVYNPGDNVDVNICFRDYTNGFPEYEKADWDPDNDGNWDVTVTGNADGPTITAIGSGNDMNSAFCINVQFTAGSQGNLISITATAKGNTNGCEHTQTQNYTLLPIILESFDVKLVNETAILNWVTASEFNNDFFNVQMSLDGKTFEDIGEIKGAGNSLDRNEYSFAYELSKEQMATPFIYFRLKQTDFDGLTSESDIVLLNTGSISKSEFDVINVYYDNSSLAMNVTSMKTGNINVKMVDMNGNAVFNTKIGVSKGYNELNIPVENTKPGIYVLQIANNNQTEIKKLFIN